MSKALDVTDQSFDQEVLKSSIPVMLDAWAGWCAPCKVIAPTIDALANEYDGKVKFVKLDVDHNPESSIKYNIRSIPTLLFFKNGKVVNQLVGALPKETLVKHLDEL